MDINTFYQHALQLKHQQEEAERLQAEQMARELEAQWKEVAAVVREALPIEGMAIMETTFNQFKEFPSRGFMFTVDCVFDQATQTMVAAKRGQLIAGVVRVRIYWETEDGPERWKIDRYETLVADMPATFETPYQAFLSVYEHVQGGKAG